ncbi:hypothetical protein Q7A53_07860 [Halobacillus rhizosphaerae]|uniref:hypothetical protein n=1 Tax=Halobacillus rhizosphaerae TaxID=3064889 RepID=UPI00398AE76A
MFNNLTKRLLLGILAVGLTVPTAVFAGTGNIPDGAHFKDRHGKFHLPPLDSLDQGTRTKAENILNQLKSGEITIKEAKTKLTDLGIKIPEAPFANLDEATKTKLLEIKQQVKDGKITKEEARTKMEKLGIQLPSRPWDHLDEETKAKFKDIHQQVKDGKMTREEARAKKKELGLTDFRHGDHHHGKFMRNLTDEQKNQLKLIRGQLLSGEITKQEAKNKLRKLGIKVPIHRENSQSDSSDKATDSRKDSAGKSQS